MRGARKAPRDWGCEMCLEAVATASSYGEVSPFSREGTEAQDRLNDLVRGSSIYWHIFK